MPSAAYTAWLDLAATSRIVLCELQAKETLTTWTAAGGGHTNVYTVGFESIVQADVVPGGVYRRLDGVRQNGTDLTVRASLAALDAASEGYFYDSTTSTLYAKSTTGSDPDSFAWFGAVFSIFVGTQPVDFVGGELFEPRLTGALPSVEAEVENPLYGIKAYPEGEIDLSNADRFFDKLVRGWIWKEQTVSFYFGGGDLAFADYELVAVMRIEDMVPGDSVCRFLLRHVASVLDKFLPLNTISAVDYPNLADGLSGSYKPLLWGQVTDIPGLLVDDTVGAEVYLVADGDVQDLYAVTAVRAINRQTLAVVTLTLTTHYTVNLGACTVTIVSATYKAADYEIRIDAKGEVGGLAGYLSTFGEISADLLDKLGEPAARIDATAFSDADADAPSALGLWIREGRTAAEYVRLLEQSVLGSLFVGNDGRWTAQIWDPTYETADLVAFDDADFVTFEPDDKLEALYSEIRIKYANRPATGDWSIKRTTDDAVRYGYETSEALTVETALIDETAAGRLAERFALTAGSPSIEVTTELRGLSAMTLYPLAKITATRERAPDVGGMWSEKVLEVLFIRKSLGPPKVTIRIGDLRGFGDRVGRWMESTAPDYDVATDAERSQSGYWSDTNGLADPADAGSREVSLWY